MQEGAEFGFIQYHFVKTQMDCWKYCDNDPIAYVRYYANNKIYLQLKILKNKQKTNNLFWMQVPRSDLQTLGDTIIVCTIQCCCPKGEWKCSCLLVSTATAYYSPAPYNVVYSRPVRSSHIKGTELSLQIKCCKPSSALYSLPSFLFTSSKYLDTFSLAHSQFYFIDNKTQPIYTRHHETYRNFYQRVPSPSRVDTRRSSLLATP